jgi:phosphoglycolate phosphatase
MALIRLGFGLTPQAPEYAEHRQRLLDIYAANLARDTRLFPGMADVLDELDRRDICWGVVTNKPGWLTEPLLTALSVAPRAACIVSGDTTAEKKPHPEPLLHACRLVRQSPGECVYIGDAERDIEAGRRAGMFTIAALFGYLGETDNPATWLADAQAATPQDILPALDALDRRIRS